MLQQHSCVTLNFDYFVALWVSVDSGHAAYCDVSQMGGSVNSGAVVPPNTHFVPLYMCKSQIVIELDTFWLPHAKVRYTDCICLTP